MKRRLDDADDGFLQNPTKMMSTGTGAYAGSNMYPTVGTSPEQIGRPLLASTPQTVFGTGERRRLTPTSQRTAGITFQFNPAAENELRHVIDNFVSVYEQLDKSDNPDVKPNYSYSELAYLAMLRSPNFCLPIGQIYSYIQSRFKFFRNSTRKHWKNAVRHSLAKTMCFNKIPVGRGTSTNENLARSTYLWCILPNSIACFARGDYRATVDKESGTNTLRSAYFRTNSEQFWNSVGDYIANKMALFKATLGASPNPGLIFESQTCVFPWKQQNLAVSKSLQRREVFQNVQNTQYQQSNNHQRNSPLNCVPAQSQLRYPMSSPQTELPSTQPHSSPNLHMYHTQMRSSSPVLRMPDVQPQNHLSFVERGTPSHISNPWLPGFTGSSPEPSFSGPVSPALDRGTHQYTSFNCSDSGYAEYSTSESCCQFQNSCESMKSERAIISPVHGQFGSDHPTNDEYIFNQFDLSPFSLSDFSDSSESMDRSRVTPEKRPVSPALPNVAPSVGRPMYISTPVATQGARPQPCRFMYQPVLPMQTYGNAVSTNAPLFFITADGMFSTDMLPPNWVSYS